MCPSALRCSPRKQPPRYQRAAMLAGWQPNCCASVWFLPQHPRAQPAAWLMLAHPKHAAFDACRCWLLGTRYLLQHTGAQPAVGPHP